MAEPQRNLYVKSVFRSHRFKSLIDVHGIEKQVSCLNGFHRECVYIYEDQS